MTVELPIEDFAELERYELHEEPPYRFETSRREFVQVLGSGLLIAVSSSRLAHAQRGRDSRSSTTIAERFHIGADGIVTVLTSKVEVGQGSRTQLTQAAAEEWNLPVERIRLIMADTQLCPDDGGTAGSRTTPSTVPRIRAASAAARELLASLAAEKLNVDRRSLRFRHGIFTANGQELSLAALAADREFLSQQHRPLADDVALAPVSEWQVLGASVPHVKAQDIVTGKAEFPSDVRREGMLYGKILRPPAYGAVLTSIDLQSVRGIVGVRVVRDGDFVGCTAPTSWQAQIAIEALAATAQWETMPQVSSDQLFDHLKRTVRAGRGRRDGADRRDLDAALAGAAHQFQATYTAAYVQHAPMEPRAAVAEWNEGSLTVWTGTQQPSRVQGQLAEAFRLPSQRVRVIVPDTGGGFGGKHTGEVAIEAARLAKEVGRPVSLRWTREEEFTWAYFRPAGLMELQAGLNESGRLTAWEFLNYNAGGSAIETPYQVEVERTDTVTTDSPLRQGSYRALASTVNTFAREVAMDELAELAGADPLEFRLSHLPEGRLKDVLIAAAERFDWASRSRSNRSAAREGGPAVGLACGTEKGSYVAACAEVEVREGRIVIHAICEAYECGAIQNPANTRAQVEGCIIMGLGGALSEEIRFEGGKITNASFSQYIVPRMRDVPPIDVVLLDRPDLPSVGAGETPIIAIAPAIANAVYYATGQRLRSMPIRLA